MRGMSYLLVKRIKNSLLELIRKPSRLILTILVLGYVFFMGFMNFFDHEDVAIQSFNLNILGAIVLVAMIFFVGMGVAQGFSKGSTIFSMSDVNFAFVSPIKPNKILGFSMLYQAGKILLFSVFFISYSFMVKQYFDVPPAAPFVLMGCIGGSLLFSQVLSMGIYILTVGQKKKKVLLGVLIGVMLAAAAGYIGYQAVYGAEKPSLEMLYTAANAPVLEWIPFVGWLKGVFMAVVNGNQALMFVYLGLLALSILLFFVLVTKSNPDYYEDVLQTTEKMHQLKQDIKAGRSFQNSNNINVGMGGINEKVPKVRGMGLNHGKGASAFFWKHVRELKRSSRLLFVDKTTLSVLLSSLFVVFIMKIAMQGDELPLSPNWLMAIAAGMSAYMLLIFNAMGQWTQELLKPYIFLVPQSAFKKLLWSTGTTILKPAFDGVLIFAIIGLIAGASPITIVACMGIYISFGYFFTAGNVLSERVFGQMSNKGMILMLYMAMITIVLAPGVIMGVVLMVLMEGLLPMAILGAVPVIIWNLLVGTLIIFIFRNILHNMENSKL